MNEITIKAKLDGEIFPITLQWHDKGLSKIKLGTETTLAKKVRVPTEIEKLAAELKLYFSGKLKSFSFNWFDESCCSEFQKRVYTAARKIGFGKTKTYAELARKIGQPKASRAVGTALGKNPWPLIIPCHRIKSKTSLGGFSAPGGIKTKQCLLTLES